MEMELNDENIQKMIDQKKQNKKQNKLLNILAKNQFEIRETPDGLDAAYDPEKRNAYWVKDVDNYPAKFINLKGPLKLDKDDNPIKAQEIEEKRC